MRPLDLSRITLVHDTRRRSPLRFTLMEAVAVANGGKRTETPHGVCPALATFGNYLNDGPWPTDAARTAALLPLVPLLTRHRSTPDLRERRRAYFADCLVRWYLPIAAASVVLAAEAEEMPCSGLRAAAGRYVEAPAVATLAGLREALERHSRLPMIDTMVRMTYQALTARPSAAILASTLDDLTWMLISDQRAVLGALRLAADHLAHAAAMR